MGNLNDEEYMKLVGAEVCEILKNIPKEDYYKVPKSITSLFEPFENEKIVKKLDLSKGIQEQEITQEAKDIIFLISLNYWLDEEQKKIALKNMKINEQKFNEKYSHDNLFKTKKNTIIDESKNDEQQIQENQTLIAQKKENFLTRLINKLFGKIFRKKS